jgi:hypothetical protein
MCLQTLDRDEEVSRGGEEANHGGEEESHDEAVESAQHGRCRREEENEGEGSVDDTCWRTCRPCWAC